MQFYASINVIVYADRTREQWIGPFHADDPDDVYENLTERGDDVNCVVDADHYAEIMEER